MQVDTSFGNRTSIDVGLLPCVSGAGQLAPSARPGHQSHVVIASALGRIQIFDSAQHKNIAQLRVRLIVYPTRPLLVSDRRHSYWSICRGLSPSAQY